MNDRFRQVEHNVVTGETTETLMELRGIGKSFGNYVALSDVNLSIHEGEFLSLLGPSGCGKTTLLRILAGLEHPDKGRVFGAGVDITEQSARERITKMVFQSYALFPHLSVERNIAYGLRKRRLGRAETRRKVDEALALVRLTEVATRMPHEISGGQRQRVALARAVVCDPKVLLLDEPLSALDRQLREHMRLELKRLQKKLGITFVLVTHDQEEALAMSTRVVVMDRGRILQSGSVEEIYNQPINRTVANFIGAINTFKGIITDTGNGQCVMDTPGFGKLSGAFLTDLPLGTPIEVGVRPENLQLLDSSLAGPNSATGLIEEVTFLGSRKLLSVRIIERDEPLVVEWAPLSMSLDNTEVGQKVVVHIAERDVVHLRNPAPAQDRRAIFRRPTTKTD